jgi:hypothetical protein
VLAASRLRGTVLVVLAMAAALTTSAVPAAAASKPVDRDHDRLPDRWEKRYHISTKQRSGRQDPDHDGLNNRKEYLRHLNPRRADTDGDGLTDSYEVTRSHTAPTVVDTDSDSLSDGAEVTSGYNPTDPASPGGPARIAPTPAPTPGGPVRYVDVRSIGGRCDDTRSPDAVTSPATPWCSIQRAVDALPGGGTVMVRGGDYPKLWIGRIPRTNFLVLRAYNGEPVSLAGMNGEDATYTHSGAWTGNSAYLRFEGMRFTDMVDLAYGTRKVQIVGCDFDTSQLYLRLTRDVLVEDNNFHNTVPGGHAVGADGFSSVPSRAGNWNLTIRGNRFTDIGHDGIAVLWGAYNLLIEGNEFNRVLLPQGSDLHVDAIQLNGGDGIVLRDNLIHDSEHGLMLKDTLAAKNVVIENNVFARMRGWGMMIWDAPGARLTNNTVWDTGFGTSFQDIATIPEQNSAVLRNNIFDKLNTGDRSYIASQDYNLIGGGYGYPAGPHDIWDRTTGNLPAAARPRFVDPANANYALADRSPGIDAGTSDGAPDRDLLGFPRFDDPGVVNRGGSDRPYVDMGAYERVPAGTAARRNPRR